MDEAIRSIMQSAAARGGMSEQSFDAMTAQEMEQSKADSYNEASGDLNDQDGWNCDTCHNKGQIMRPIEVRPGVWSTCVRECKCMVTRRSIRLLERSGLKNVITEYTFPKFKAEENWQVAMKEAAEQFLAEGTGWFFVGGQPGSGKTHICAAICRSFLLNGIEVRYMLWRDDVVKLKSCVNDTEEYTSQINRFKNAKVLYIDDLFKTGRQADGSEQKPTAADINIAFEILNHRYNDKSLITIISSECMLADILDIDEAIGSRIYERAKAKILNLSRDRSKNYRLRNAVEL